MKWSVIKLRFSRRLSPCAGSFGSDFELFDQPFGLYLSSANNGTAPCRNVTISIRRVNIENCALFSPRRGFFLAFSYVNESKYVTNGCVSDWVSSAYERSRGGREGVELRACKGGEIMQSSRVTVLRSWINNEVFTTAFKVLATAPGRCNF